MPRWRQAPRWLGILGVMQSVASTLTWSASRIEEVATDDLIAHDQGAVEVLQAMSEHVALFAQALRKLHAMTKRQLMGQGLTHWRWEMEKRCAVALGAVQRLGER